MNDHWELSRVLDTSRCLISIKQLKNLRQMALKKWRWRDDVRLVATTSCQLYQDDTRSADVAPLRVECTQNTNPQKKEWTLANQSIFATRRSFLPSGYPHVREERQFRTSVVSKRMSRSRFRMSIRSLKRTSYIVIVSVILLEKMQTSDRTFETKILFRWKYSAYLRWPVKIFIKRKLDTFAFKFRWFTLSTNLITISHFISFISNINKVSIENQFHLHVKWSGWTTDRRNRQEEQEFCSFYGTFFINHHHLVTFPQVTNRTRVAPTRIDKI